MSNCTKFNAKMWDEWSCQGVEWTRPISHEAFLAAQNGQPALKLTPQKLLPLNWLPPRGSAILGLASGGGQQGPQLSAAGYRVTILDLSERQLISERMVAEREGYTIGLVKADMTAPFPFADGAFDAVINPVSNCYIEDLAPFWREAFRVLKPSGVLMAGWTNPIVYAFDDASLEDPHLPLTLKFALPYNGREQAEAGQPVTMDSGYQFSHTWEEQLGGQLQAGFLIKDFYEDSDDRDKLSYFTALYAASLAVKPG